MTPIPHSQTPSAREQLIVALDYPARRPALELIERLAEAGNPPLWYKVGLELYLAEGRALVEEIRSRGYRVFLDLKLHDIPNTVAGAVGTAAASGAELLTVHTLGGPAMLRAAAQAAGERGIRLLGVTVLTSMDRNELSAVGVSNTPAAEAELLAQMGVEAGLSGFVCSPEEVRRLREITGPQAALVIPGIRPAGAEIGDQKRTATPASALAAGASFLVVGRPITKAPDPAAALADIFNEMRFALK